MATKAQKIAEKINDQFSAIVKDEVKNKFGIDVETEYNILALRKITFRSDGEDFTREQAAFIEAFSTGYIAALNIVRYED